MVCVCVCACVCDACDKVTYYAAHCSATLLRLEIHHSSRPMEPSLARYQA